MWGRWRYCPPRLSAPSFMIPSRLHALADGDCATVVSSTLTHRDVYHLTIVYAEAVTEPLAQRLGLW